jgi:hypothetical protein
MRLFQIVRAGEADGYLTCLTGAVYLNDLEAATLFCKAAGFVHELYAVHGERTPYRILA